MSPVLPALLLAQLIGSPAPDPRLTPEQVVRIVADALHHNNSPNPNAGIFTTYRFASPANHAVTGPYGRFLRTVRTPAFAPMRGDHTTEFDAIARDADHASQVMRIWIARDTAVEYQWDLSLQQEGVYRGCWMVDGVSRLPPK